jgi:uncharacterized repeat protein (TIGR03803 family)
MRICILSLCGVLVTSCARVTGASPLPVGLSNGTHLLSDRSNATSYKQLFSFDGTDGALPGAALTNVGGRLYGTTDVGGAHYAGTVFGITAAGREKVI